METSHIRNTKNEFATYWYDLCLIAFGGKIFKHECIYSYFMHLKYDLCNFCRAYEGKYDTGLRLALDFYLKLLLLSKSKIVKGVGCVCKWFAPLTYTIFST